MNNKAKGNIGESVAKRHLVDKGYRVIATNYTTSLGEIDLIVTDNLGTLIFVEVKARGSTKYGYPAEAVMVSKQRKISQVAAQYIKQFQLYGYAVRFDVVEIIGEDIRHIENAFDSYLRY